MFASRTFLSQVFRPSRALAFGQPLNHHPLNQVVEKKKVNDFYPPFDKEDEKYCCVKEPHYDLDFPKNRETTKENS